MLVWFWLGLIILFLVIEAVTVGLATIWFAAGALAAGMGLFIGKSPILFYCKSFPASEGEYLLGRWFQRKA